MAFLVVKNAGFSGEIVQSVRSGVRWGLPGEPAGGEKRGGQGPAGEFMPALETEKTDHK